MRSAEVGFDREQVVGLVRTALAEDLRYGPDITTAATVSADATTTAAVVARRPGVVAGIEVGLLVLDEVIGAHEYRVGTRLDDGAAVDTGEVVIELYAPTRGLLTAERTMLNLLCHLSGIATTTAAWVEAVAGTHCRIRDSRKTLPGLRELQKYAVRMGGGVNHRMGLGDAALVKDNHVIAAGGVVQALRAVRERRPDIVCEVEVDRLDQLDAVLAEDVGLVLLDNFPLRLTRAAVRRRDARAPNTMLESSGGLHLGIAADYARTGVDYLAVGGLTHSVTALDLGLDM